MGFSELEELPNGYNPFPLPSVAYFRWLSFVPPDTTGRVRFLVGLRRQAMNNREETELAQPAINLPIELVIGSFYVTGATSNDDL